MDKYEKELLLEAIAELEEKGGWWIENNKKFHKIPVEVLKGLYNKLSIKI